jgi:hypothetical protein
MKALQLTAFGPPAESAELRDVKKRRSRGR